ncbi:MAG: hypothetical protein M3Y71_05300 [Actinomycetota bacterium]|nr:hypothetical protein [Actinomycetota bacterium]
MTTSGSIELRVHGVSGTPPDSLLDRQTVHRVGGDNQAGFYRPSLEQQARDTTPNPPFSPGSGDGPQLEGYSWGGLTSGSSGRALWLALLPFTLANLAVRARPDIPARGLVWRVFWGCSRVIALGLTALFVLTTVGIGDAVAGACPAGGCEGRPAVALVGWVSRLPPGWEMVVSSLVPALAVLGLWGISQRTLNRYEAVTAVVTGRTGQRAELDTVPAPQLEENLDSLGMWHNASVVRTLRARHVQLGLSLVVFSLLWGQWLWWVVGAAVVLALGVSVCREPAAPGPVDPRTGEEQRSRVHLVPWALIVLGAVLGVLRVAGMDDTEASATFGRTRAVAFDHLLIGVLVLLVVAVTVLAGVNVWCRRGAGPGGSSLAPMTSQPHACRGMASTCFTVLAVFLGLVYSGAFYLYGVAFLTTGSLRPSLDEVAESEGKVAVSVVIELGAIATLVGVVVLVVAALAGGAAAALGYRAAGHGDDPAVNALFEADFGAPPDDPAERPRTAQVKQAIFVGSLVDRGPVVIVTLALGGVFCAVVAGVVGVIGKPAHGPAWWRWVLDPVHLQAIGAYVAVYGLILLIALGAAAFRVERTRRLVGILWDVASFWPRTVHPLAAPCYAERAVPDLVTRTSWLLHGEHQRVVLAAHSQGTVLAAATVFHLVQLEASHPADHSGNRVPELRLLTFGCVLRRLYGRYYPVYFGPRRMQALYEELAPAPAPPPGAAATGVPQTTTQPAATTGAWLNLWRDTDYLGGLVSGGPPYLPHPPAPVTGQPASPASPPSWERHLRDPWRLPRVEGFTTYPAPKAHTDFWNDESGDYQVAVRDLLR